MPIKILNFLDFPVGHMKRESHSLVLSKFVIGHNKELSDKVFMEKCQSVLAGFFYFIYAKCERASVNDKFIAKIYTHAMKEPDILTLKKIYKAKKANEMRALIMMAEKGELTLENYLPVGTWCHIPDEHVGRKPSYEMLSVWVKNLLKRLKEGRLHEVIREAEKFDYPKSCLKRIKTLAEERFEEQERILRYIAYHLDRIPMDRII